MTSDCSLGIHPELAAIHAEEMKPEPNRPEFHVVERQMVRAPFPAPPPSSSSSLYKQKTDTAHCSPTRTSTAQTSPAAAVRRAPGFGLGLGGLGGVHEPVRLATALGPGGMAVSLRPQST